MEDQEKIEREDELVHLIGYLDNWQLMEQIAVKGFDVNGKTVLKPNTGTKIIAVHPKVRLVVTNYELSIIRHLLIPNKLLRLSITTATEEDILIHMCKDRMKDV